MEISVSLGLGELKQLFFFLGNERFPALRNIELWLQVFFLEIRNGKLLFVSSEF